MIPQDDMTLDRELVAYLQAMGVPPPLARLSARLTRIVQTEETQLIAAEASGVHEAMVAWFVSRERSNLLPPINPARVEAVTLVDGAALGTRSPKLVLSTLAVVSVSPKQTSITVRNSAKVGRLSGRKIVATSTAACAHVAADIRQALASLTAP